MATEDDLINAVRKSLEDGGQLGRMRAEIRTVVMKLLDGTSESNRIQNTETPPPNVLLINEIVREYLEWIGYKYTSSVLVAESSLSKQPLDRSFLLQHLGVNDSETTNKLPLLVSLIETIKHSNSAEATPAANHKNL